MAFGLLPRFFDMENVRTRGRYGIGHRTHDPLVWVDLVANPTPRPAYGMGKSGDEGSYRGTGDLGFFVFIRHGAGLYILYVTFELRITKNEYPPDS